MTKTQLEERMNSFSKDNPISDERLFKYVMQVAMSENTDGMRIQMILDVLLRGAKSRMDNLRAMTEGYKGSIRKDYYSNLYVLTNILTSKQPIRKKLIVAIAFVNTLYERS